MNSVWSQLSEWVYRMVKEKKTDTEEFRAALSWYGREKLLQEYRKEKQKQEKELETK